VLLTLLFLKRQKEPSIRDKEKEFYCAREATNGHEYELKDYAAIDAI
jgi:hypothetical protein